MDRLSFPPWVILHIPHNSKVIPSDIRVQFLLSDAELELELQRMTDHFTLELFAGPHCEAVVVYAPVSRLVVDVERFSDDAKEAMVERGMGAVYGVTSHLTPLRRHLSQEERDALMHLWYHPHHIRLEAAVTEMLEKFGKCLIIDGHSFPGTPLPYEKADPNVERPDICIGSDPFHTPKALERSFVESFGRDRWRVSVNEPFAGALVPISRYKLDSRVMAVMVEINRDLYMGRESLEPNKDFDRVAKDLKNHCTDAIWTFHDQIGS
jgi:N-formylglutamate deformylase